MNPSDFDIESDVFYLSQRIKDLGNDHTSNKLKLVKYLGEISKFDLKEELVDRSREAYKGVVDEVYSRSMGEIENVLNSSLQYIFFDKNYSVKIEISDFRSKIINIMLYDNDFTPSRVVDTKNGVGNGIRTAISFILLTYYLISLGRMPFIFADEAYSGISEAYVDRYFNFISEMCKKKGLKFVLITHDDRFLIYGAKRYSVTDGNVIDVTEVSEEQ